MATSTTSSIPTVSATATRRCSDPSASQPCSRSLVPPRRTRVSAAMGVTPASMSAVVAPGTAQAPPYRSGWRAAAWIHEPTPGGAVPWTAVEPAVMEAPTETNVRAAESAGPFAVAAAPTGESAGGSAGEAVPSAGGTTEVVASAGGAGEVAGAVLVAEGTGVAAAAPAGSADALEQPA